MGDLTVGENIIEQTSSQNLASAALSYTTTFGTDFELDHITFHLSVASTQTIKITIDSLTGSNYDTVIYEDTIKNLQNFIWTPSSKFVLKKGNEIKIELTNNGTPASTVYVVASGNQA